MKSEINQKELKEFFDKGVLAYEKKNYDYAIEIFSQILSSKYDHLEARHLLHLSLKNKLGIKTSLISNILNSITSFFIHLSVDSLLKKGHVARALENLEKIIAKNPSDIRTLKKMAVIFYNQNLIPHTIQNLEEAKSINPKDIEVFKKLGEIYLKKEDYKNAKLNYEEALRLSPNDPEVLRAIKNLDALGTIQRDFSIKRDPHPQS